MIKVKALHEEDLAAGFGEVYLPFALDKKYPNAECEWGWQYIFPSKNLSVDPRLPIFKLPIISASLTAYVMQEIYHDQRLHTQQRPPE